MTVVDLGDRPEAELVTWLDALRELSAASTSSTDLRQVLNLVADTARSLLGFDFVGVLTPDAGGENLLITGWSGLSAEYVARVNSDRPIGLDSGSPSSQAFRGAKPVALHDITDEPEFRPWGGVAREQGYRAIVCVPLVAGGDVLGTLNGYYTPVHTFTGFEIERVILLANHAAIALTSASRLDELRELNESLREQRDALTRSERIHERLLGVSLRSGGLKGIAAVLAELIDRPVLIEDSSHVVLAVAGDANDLPDAEWRVRARVDPSASTAPVPVSPSDDEPAQFFVAVARLGDDVVARTWFPHRGTALDTVGVRAVEHASIVISLELLRLQTAIEVELRLRGELLADVLGTASVMTEQLMHRAQRLGHDLTRPHVAIVGALGDIGEVVETRSYQRCLSAVSELVAQHRPRPLAAMHRGNVVVLWPVGDDALERGVGRERRGHESAAALVQRAMTSASARTLAATVAVSPRGISTHGEAYRVAKGALDIAMRAGRTNALVELDDLGVLGLLLQLDDPVQLVAFADRTLGPLLAYDDSHHTHLVATLRSYFGCKLDRAATAAALHVHANTVTQRLQRIQTLCSVDLTDPSVTMQFSAALTVHEVATVG